MWLISDFLEFDRLRSRENRQEALGCREEVIPKRHKAKPIIDIGPGKDGGLLERFAGSYRSQEGLEWADERLKGVGFTKGEEGNRVSYRREMIGYHLYADPRPDTRINIYVYPGEKEGVRRKRRSDSPFPVLVDLPNTWKHDLEEKLASKIRKYCHE
jgi:hypothetical protein